MIKRAFPAVYVVLTLFESFSGHRTAAFVLLSRSFTKKSIGRLWMPIGNVSPLGANKQSRSNTVRLLFLQALSSSSNANNDDPLLELAIDSFLRGEYDRPFAEDAPAPHPGLTEKDTVKAALRALRDLDDPEPSHGAAVFQRFLVPLSRGERWGETDNWKEVLRGALTATMLAKRIRASEFSGLLDWTKLDVTDGYSLQNQDHLVGVPSIAFVNAALYFRGGTEPCIIQFTLRRISGVWLIDTARLSRRGLFVDNENQKSDS